MRKFKNLLEMFIFGLVKFISLFPFWILYALSDLLFLIAYYLIGYRKKVVRKNLRLVFPELDDKERKRIEKRFYHHLCDVMVETIKLLSLSDKSLGKRVTVVDAELVDKNCEEGKSTILFLGHYGNWEWVPFITRHFHKQQVFAQIYSPLKDSAVGKTVHAIRNRFGAENISKDRAYRRLLEIQHNGKRFVTGFISDQRPLGTNLHHWTNFLGIDSAYMAGGETIGKRLGADFLYLDVNKTGRGRYTLTFRPLEVREDGEENPVTRAYLREMEATIRRDPAIWLWSHNRWKAQR